LIAAVDVTLATCDCTVIHFEEDPSCNPCPQTAPGGKYPCIDCCCGGNKRRFSYCMWL